MHRLLAMALGTSLLLGAGLASAAPPAGKAAKPAPDTRYQQKTIVDFEEDFVDGTRLRPDGTYIETRTGVKVSSLIKLRTNFIPEMLKSVNDL